MQTSFLIQATYMRLKFQKFTVPAASLSIFDSVAVLILIPIMDHIIYPLLRYCGIRFTPLRRVGVGMILAAASVVVAGVVEIKRRDVWKSGHSLNQNVFNESRNASDLNIFLQVPQFMLIGSSEVLTSITGMDTTFKLGSRVGAVVRALAFHQCVPGSIPGLGVICGLSLLVLYSAPRGFSPLLKNQHLI